MELDKVVEYLRKIYSALDMIGCSLVVIGLMLMFLVIQGCQR